MKKTLVIVDNQGRLLVYQRFDKYFSCHLQGEYVVGIERPDKELAEGGE
jgi:hypothetical protein